MTAEFILGVDLDGVCGDYNTSFRDAVARHRDIDPEMLTMDVSWDFLEWGLDREGFLSHHQRALTEDRVFLNMAPIQGVQDSLWRLSDAGVWIRLITHRLVDNWSHAMVVSDTVEWLDEHSIPYRDICFLGQKPQVEADAYIDDAPHNVDALREADNDVIVFSQPYNLEMEGPRADNWDDVETIVSEMAARKTGGFPLPLPGFDAGSDRLARNRPQSNLGQ